MLDPVIVGALVVILKVLADKFLPGFPISEELLNAVVVFLLGLFGLNAVKAGARKFLPVLFKRGLLKSEG